MFFIQKEGGPILGNGMGPPWPDCIFIRTDFLVQNIQCVNTVFFFKCLRLFSHFDLKIRCSIIISIFKGFVQAGADALFFFCILGKFDAGSFDGFPSLLVKFVIVIKFLVTFDSSFRSRNDTVDQFILPAVEDGSDEGFNDIQTVAGGLPNTASLCS